MPLVPGGSWWFLIAQTRGVLLVNYLVYGLGGKTWHDIFWDGHPSHGYVKWLTALKCIVYQQH